MYYGLHGAVRASRAPGVAGVENLESPHRKNNGAQQAATPTVIPQPAMQN